MFVLEFRNCENAPPVILPEGLTILLGRGRQCDVQIQDESVSRIHCRITAGSESVILQDAGSRFGTQVNGVRRMECHLRPGDLLCLGDTILEVQRSSELPGPEERLNLPESADSGPSPFSASLFAGQEFSGCRVQSVVAETRNGILFQAVEVATGIPVALKIYRSSVFREAADEQRFLRSAALLSQLNDASLVPLRNFGQCRGWHFTAALWIPGISAAALAMSEGIRNMLPPVRVLQIAMNLVQALHVLESRRLIHREICPEHILIRHTDQAAVLNISALLRPNDREESVRLTSAGELPGDVEFKSPEQLGSGYPADHRSDIYQLGATLYCLLTGVAPLSGGSVVRTIDLILSEPPAPVRTRNMAVPASFESIVLKMLAKNPRDRYQSASVLGADLQRVAAEMKY